MVHVLSKTKTALKNSAMEMKKLFSWKVGTGKDLVSYCGRLKVII
jgi:hypothetical protein